MYAQDGANAKKPSVDGSKNEDKTGNSTENIKVDQTEVISKDYANGEPIELYDLIYMLLPDESEGSKTMKWESLNDVTSVIWGNKFYNDIEKVFKKNGKALLLLMEKKFCQKSNFF